MLQVLLTLDLILVLLCVRYHVKATYSWPDPQDAGREGASYLALSACLVLTLLALIWS